MRRRPPLLQSARYLLAWFVLCSATFHSGAANDATDASQAGDLFFEQQVRPILVRRCTSCHGAETQESQLRLDSRAAALRGGESGPALMPGDRANSRILEFITNEPPDTQMPPDDRLPAEEISVLKRWVEIGAPWPQRVTEQGPMQERIEVARKSHWALQPVQPPEVPQLKDPWIEHPVDAFTFRLLREAGLSPSPSADKRTLIRRATYDLTGLPPSPRQVKDFLRDTSEQAFARVVDRLLGSPEYGKRWGRHWLDVARYADTRGYSIGREPRLPFAYTYRDYVVRAFNSDKPYDSFIREQLAADQYELADKRDLAALGFLTVGRRYSRIHDTIDDRIDVVTRGLLGMTTSCARCHDHKFDPIPTADYYSLYGVFASSEEPAELPLIEERNGSPEHKRFFAELAKRQAALDSFVQTKRDELLEHLRSRVSEYLAQLIVRAEVVPADAGISLGKDEIKPKALRRWAAFLATPDKIKDPVFALWVRFAAIGEADFSRRAAEICDLLVAKPELTLNGLVRQAFVERTPESMLEVAQVYGQLLEKTYDDWKQGHEIDEDTASDVEQLRQALFGDATPTAIPEGELRGYFDRETGNRQRELSRKVEEWNAGSPDAPPRAMVLADRKNPVQAVVFQRGDPARRGEVVPRRFLRALSPGGEAFENGSGRGELAAAVANHGNPLTARVLVNRIWLHHFGKGLVTTPSDFGIRTPPPSHPQLLDHLSWNFMQQGWSIKRLHREIMLSATYQQSSRPRDDCVRVDPENRLLWRMNRRRLEFEAFRDSLLFVSGQLDHQIGGRPVEMWKPPHSRRSTIYGLVDRQHLAGVLRVFDFASPDASTPQRTLTVVPQQALYTMNSPFVAEQARHVVARSDVQQWEPEQRIIAVYEIIFGRVPSEEELDFGSRFVTAASESRAAATTQGPWAQYVQALLMSNELTFVD